jgi:hypothetical protein
MPFKSDKQRKWMHANEPEMAKKWEKEESIRETIRGFIKQEMKSMQAFSKSTQNAIDIDDEDDSESVREDNIKFSKEEMAQLHKDGKVEKGSHTIEFNESTKEYGKTLDKIAKDRQLKFISKKDRDTLIKISKLMKRANESVNELTMAPFSSQEAKLHINADIRDMSKLLGKTSYRVIKIMVNGVKSGKYTAMDISRGIKEGPANRTHFGEMTFIQSLWNKMREKFRKYSKDGKLS